MHSGFRNAPVKKTMDTAEPQAAPLPKDRPHVDRTAAIVLWAIAVVLGILVTLPAWSWLVRRWVDGQYLPGVLAALLTAFFAVRIFRRRCEPMFAPASTVRLLLGAALVFAGALFAWLSFVIESSVLLGWCLPLILTGLLLPYAGPGTRVRKVLPLIVYSALIFPPPTVVSSALSLPIRLAAARIAAFILSAFGVECIARGVVVQTLHYRASVVPACGGEEVIHLFLVIGIALAYLQQRERLGIRFWVQAAAAAPIALIANGVRIAVLTGVGHIWGEAAAAGFFHEFGGLLVFAVFLVAMIAVGEVFSRIRLPLREASDGEGLSAESCSRAEGPPDSTPRVTAPSGLGCRTRLALGVMQCAVLATAGALNWWGEFVREQTKWGKPLQQVIPADLPGWTWQTLLLTISEESYLARNYVIKRAYRKGSIEVILFATTGAEGRRQAFHSPEICYRGDGWDIIEKQEHLADPGRPGRRPLRFNLLRAKYGEQVATTIYWLDDGTTRTADLVVKRPSEIFRRLRHPFHPRERWALIAVTSLHPDPQRALCDCLTLARDLP